MTRAVGGEFEDVFGYVGDLGSEMNGDPAQVRKEAGEFRDVFGAGEVVEPQTGDARQHRRGFPTGRAPVGAQFRECGHPGDLREVLGDELFRELGEAEVLHRVHTC
ncbi:hypothetical protein [Streptomyces europaeiscabiei]|uniref:hypothetical protein n=1 Tax=Streptomyces europaeiscabiei TaxID=146819 RepID=UPI0029BA5344|nr:hypothetical protein [Streptomyces europaeiscabiei]MDX2772515.1 hypothetical protein [Streptomyces europaeiscabiei]